MLQVFSVTRLNEEHRWIESSPFRVLLVSERMDQVLAYGGLRLTPDVTIDNCPELDLLIVPGGWGTRTEVRNNNLLNWIAVRAAKTRLTASVCTGSSLLGKAGLLDGHEATTHWRAFDFLRESAPRAQIREDVRFTLVEPIFTSAQVFSWNRLGLTYCEPLLWNRDCSGHCSPNGISLSRERFPNSVTCSRYV